MADKPLDLRDAEQEADTNDTPSAGSGGAVSLDLGALKKDVDGYYDVATTAGDIVIEVSPTGAFSGEQRVHTRVEASEGDVATGGKFVQIDTTYQYVRMYAGSGFADADVNTLEIVSRGA